MTVERWTGRQLRDYIARQYGRDQTAEVVRLVQRWLDRGDGAAIYENRELGHPELGMCKIVSFGSPSAQLETGSPPVTLPDGLPAGAINWRYQLVATCRTGE